jgi:hypothetical protein
MDQSKHPKDNRIYTAQSQDVHEYWLTLHFGTIRQIGPVNLPDQRCAKAS